MTISQEESEGRLALRLEELQLPVLDAVGPSLFSTLAPSLPQC